VKIEGSNFNTMIIALNAFVSCDILGLEESYQGFALGVHFPSLVITKEELSWAWFHF